MLGRYKRGFLAGWDEAERVKIAPLQAEVRELADALSRILPYAESPDFQNGPPESPSNPYAEAKENAERICRRALLSNL